MESNLLRDKGFMFSKISIWTKKNQVKIKGWLFSKYLTCGVKKKNTLVLLNLERFSTPKVYMRRYIKNYRVKFNLIQDSSLILSVSSFEFIINYYYYYLSSRVFFTYKVMWESYVPHRNHFLLAADGCMIWQCCACSVSLMVYQCLSLFMASVMVHIQCALQLAMTTFIVKPKEERGES